MAGAAGRRVRRQGGRTGSYSVMSQSLVFAARPVVLDKALPDLTFLFVFMFTLFTICVFVVHVGHVVGHTF